MLNHKGIAGLAMLFGASLASGSAADTRMPGAPAATGVYGTWVNPKGTVTVRTSTCGKLLCGTVISATPEVQNIAQKAGAPSLVGTKLLQDYRQTATNRWQGRVFVPDRNASYYSTIKQLGDNQLKISGCILGGLLCKSQVWSRVS